MDALPVANQREDQQYEGNQEQSGCFRGVNRMAVMFVSGIATAYAGHAYIVAPTVEQRQSLTVVWRC